MPNKTEHIVRKSLDIQGIVQAIRKEANMSQSDVAALLNIKPGSYSEFERNLLQGSLSRFLKLMQALDVELILRPKSSEAKPSDDVPGSDESLRSSS